MKVPLEIRLSMRWCQISIYLIKAMHFLNVLFYLRSSQILWNWHHNEMNEYFVPYFTFLGVFCILQSDRYGDALWDEMILILRVCLDCRDLLWLKMCMKRPLFRICCWFFLRQHVYLKYWRPSQVDFLTLIFRWLMVVAPCEEALVSPLSLL